MSMESIEQIPVALIRVVNPRTRNRIKWLAIVASIKSVGLKKPISVWRKTTPDEDGKLYDLVCGQGRLEAHIELGETSIAAVFVKASEADRHLMSLVENIARRPSSNRTIYTEVRNLLERGNSPKVIADKFGIDRGYIYGIVRLVQCGKPGLIEQVEGGRLPISVAVEIANGNDENVQKAMMEAYATGEIRGSKLQAIRKLIKDEKAKRDGAAPVAEKPMTGAALTNLYKQRVREQQRLVLKADQAREKLLMISSLMRGLLADEDMLTMLRSEQLFDMPEQLALRAL